MLIFFRELSAISNEKNSVKCVNGFHFWTLFDIAIWPSNPRLSVGWPDFNCVPVNSSKVKSIPSAVVLTWVLTRLCLFFGGQCSLFGFWFKANAGGGLALKVLLKLIHLRTHSEREHCTVAADFNRRDSYKLLNLYKRSFKQYSQNNIQNIYLIIYSSQEVFLYAVKVQFSKCLL